MKRGCRHRSQRSWKDDALTFVAPKHLPRQGRKRRQRGGVGWGQGGGGREDVCLLFFFRRKNNKKTEMWTCFHYPDATPWFFLALSNSSSGIYARMENLPRKTTQTNINTFCLLRRETDVTRAKKTRKWREGRNVSVGRDNKRKKWLAVAR